MITLYVRNNVCPLCSQVERIIAAEGQVYSRVVVGRDLPAKAVLEMYPQFSSDTDIDGIRLPIVIKGDQIIGGYDDLLDLLGGRYKRR